MPNVALHFLVQFLIFLVGFYRKVSYANSSHYAASGQLTAID
jgi:hypothetical protein